MIRRLAGAAALALVLAAPPTPAAAEPPLTVVSWGGAYTRSQMLAIVRPYRETTDLWVRVETYNGGLEEIRAQVDSLNVTWDVVDVMLADAERGCAEGLFEPLDPAFLAPAPDGTPPAEDFMAGTLRECAIGQNLWSTVVAYNEERVGAAPASIADFFDLQRFPGDRGLRQGPQITLEWALMADGVEADLVYEVLATDAGVERALRVLDRLKGHIVWWEDGETPSRLLAEGEVAMSSAWNGRIHSAVSEQGLPLAILWDGQVWDLELWAIPRGSERFEEAQDFIAFATEPARLAEQARHIAYGPARHSAMALVPEEVRAQLPTAEGHMENALRSDFAWWAEHGERIGARFERWLDAPARTPGQLAR